jgi:hypothetical protein
MKKNKKYIFLVGVPGSRWGRIESMLYQLNSDLIDVSCKSPHQQDHPEHGTQHIYTFWGPYHEHGDQFDRLDLLGPQEVMRQIDAAYDDNDPRPYRIVRCHWFSYQLDWIRENMPWIDVLMVFREPEMSYRWWIQSGGWDISYPNYAWYGTDQVLRRQIMVEHKLMMKFAREQGLKQTHHLGKALEWFDNFMPEMSRTFKHQNLKNNPLDDTMWPVLFRGTGNTQ